MRDATARAIWSFHGPGGLLLTMQFRIAGSPMALRLAQPANDFLPRRGTLRAAQTALN